MSRVDKGREIRDKVFGGNPYAQLAALREVVELIMEKQGLMDDPDFAQYIELNNKIKEELGNDIEHE